ncbi:MarR family transcriptional regulator [Donghicola sp. C2-DW-16]|uniref:MarR family transcriptional regulator n=1 Tax=Donghicola mangrovi TaxID=2729614 RepID=A0A850QDH2_9RHOB|nr:MarR family transcriptional regulator [Donghicola mangrovi]NVO24988.1 MarR family transcriptional regulator [Donghicola mangrovi]NVO28051.1 MarR family transcriptional regulator [Donghicola mangrovi]
MLTQPTEEIDFDIRDFTPYMLNVAAEAMSEGFSRYYRENFGMTRTEWRVLFHLGRYGNMSAKELGQQSKLHKTKISRAVAGLEEKGFLTREQRPEDRRSETLILLADGTAAYDTLIGYAEEYENQLARALGVRDARALKRALAKLVSIGRRN